MAVRRAITIVLIALTVIASGIMLLSGTNPELSFIEVVFEVVSAFGTVGLSLGVTPSLGAVSKIALACIMFFGRVGVVTIMLSLTIKGFRAKNTVRYPVGRILI